MRTNFCVFLIISFTSLITGNLIGQPTFGQSDKDLQDKEKFLELGEEKFREDCYKNLNSDNKLVEEFMKELTKDLPKDFAKDACETKISKIKNETATLDQNQNRILDTVTGETSYTTHIDNSNGFTVEYPTDWHVSGDKIFKGTREFTWEKHDDPTYSILDTNSFGSIWFDIKKDEDGVKITDNFGQLMMGAEPALSFSYSLLDKEYMVVALMHNNVPYVFEYGTLKENFDKDFDTMMHFIGTIRFT